ncbi:MAG: BrnA antitoxin family protein [Treponema sp.]|nr:BrnA antitoxin family protein [Treponema sp.]MBQ1670161.1 BrnA antitoxin family protein [Treponema sp.]
MNTLVTMTLDEVERTPLTEEEIQLIKKASEKAANGKQADDPDCPVQTKEELKQFRPWYEVHPNWNKPKKTDIHIKIDTDVLEWYKSQGDEYQTKMNAVLREYAFN